MNKMKALITVATIAIVGIGMGVAESVPPNFESLDGNGNQSSMAGDGLTVDAGGPYEGEVGEPVQFTCAVTGGTGPYTYHWMFGDGASSEENPVHTYRRAGSYTVTLRVRDSSIPPNIETDTTTATITGGSNESMEVDAGGPYTGETGEEIQFNCTVTGGVAPYDYHWTFGDGASNEQNPTHAYRRAGSYTVTLRVKDSATPPNIETDTTTATITGGSNGSMEVDVGGPYNGSVGEPVQFTCAVTGGTGPYTYHWMFGDGASSEENPVHTYRRAGSYTVTLRVRDSSIPPNIETDTTTATITGGNNTTMAVVIGAPSNGSVGEEIQFNCTVTGGTPPYEYHWNFGDGGVSTEQNPTHIYQRERRHLVRLQVKDSATPPNIERNFTWININNGTLEVDIGGPYNGSVGEEIQFNCTVTGGIPPYEYHWSFGDGTHTNESNPTHIYDREKTYLVWLKVTDSAQRTHVRFDFTWVTIE